MPYFVITVFPSFLGHLCHLPQISQGGDVREAQRRESLNEGIGRGVKCWKEVRLSESRSRNQTVVDFELNGSLGSRTNKYEQFLRNVATKRVRMDDVFVRLREGS